MLEKLISLIEKYNEQLGSKTNSSNIEKYIEKILADETLTKEEKEEYYKELQNVNIEMLTEEEKDSFDFTNEYLIRNDVQLVDDQKSVISKLINVNKKELNKNNEIIKELSSDSHFEDFEGLLFAIEELNGSDNEEMHISSLDQIKICREIIVKNIEISKEKVEEEPEELDVFNNNEEDVKALLEKYDYSYDSLNSEQKEYLLKYVNLTQCEEILEALKTNGIYIKLTGDAKKIAFCKVLVYSNANTIVSVVSEYNDLLFSATSRNKENPITANNFFNSNVNYLFQAKKGRGEVSVSKKRETSKGGRTKCPTLNETELPGASDNFVKNMLFLRANNFDVYTIIKRAPVALGRNPETLKSFITILEEDYGMDLKDGQGFSGLAYGNPVKAIDRFIETSSYGYDHVLNAIGKLNSQRSLFIKIRIGEADNTSLFHGTKGNDNNNIKMYSLNNSTISQPGNDLYRVYELLTLDDKKLDALNDKYKFKVYSSKLSEITSMYETNVANQLFEGEEKEEALKDDYIKVLEDESVKQSSLLYEVNGVRISRQKVLRIFNFYKNKKININKDEIMLALLYGSIVTDEEIKKVEEFVDELVNSVTIGGKKING